MIMRYFVRFVMFLIYIDIVFVLLVFMVPAEMVYRWSDGKKTLRVCFMPVKFIGVS